MKRWVIAAWLLVGCASTSRSVVAEGDFADSSAVEYEASFDEVYDAAWLSLEKLGFRIVAHDRRQGTFKAEGYEVQVTPREARVRLQVAALATARVADLHAQVKSLLDLWRTPLDLEYLRVGHALLADGMRLPLPSTWNVLELRTDRRRFKLQALKRANQGANPTLLVEVDRRRPLPSTQPLAQEAADLAVPDVKAVVPDDAERQPVLLAGGLAAQTQTFVIQSEPFDLDAFTFTAETHAWALRAAAICPRAATVENAPDAACVAAVKGAFAAARRAPRE